MNHNMRVKVLKDNRRVYSSDNTVDSFDYKLYGEDEQGKVKQVDKLSQIVNHLILKIVANILNTKSKR